MLRQRVLTAVVLVLVLLGAMAWTPLALSAVLAVAAGVAMFEWLRLAGVPGRTPVAAGALFGCALLALQVVAPQLSGSAALPICGAALVAWFAVVLLLVQAERSGVHLGRPLLTVLAVLFLLAAWLAIQALLGGGGLLLLSALAIVWIADIAAYFVGRAFGRRRLAPRISPGKTWAGVAGAVAAVIVASFAARAAWPAAALATTDVIAAAGSAAGAIVLLALLVLASIVGDLFESLLKRQAGVKDSSRLLPGHGGVLDRIDALLPVLPLVVLIRWWHG